jgi:hypothetical protein
MYPESQEYEERKPTHLPTCPLGKANPEFPDECMVDPSIHQRGFYIITMCGPPS